MTKKHEQRKRGRGSIFQRGRGKSYDEGGRLDNSMQDKGNFEWKNDDKGKTEWKNDNFYQGGTGSYQGTGNCFRCGKEGHRSFKCISS